MAPKYEVSNVLDAHWKQLQQSGKLNTWQMRTLDAVHRCRTPSLGGHIDGCTSCGHLRISYNSCRNRHCPKCQGVEREKWIEAREQDLLPVPYFHVVFTLPDSLNQLCLHQPAVVYNILFKTAWSVINTFGKDPKWLGAQTGMIAILHTWGQTLSLHPHLHCIVPGGGLTPDGKWGTSKALGKYLFSIKAMSKVYRARFICALKEQLHEHMSKDLIDDLFKQDWVVFAKRSFNGPSSVIEYLGRYTHKIAISNHRLEDISGGNVTFRYKDYRDKGTSKSMTLEGLEFIRRFALHILPKAFIRIRHYGILSSSRKKEAAKIIKQQLPEAKPIKSKKPKLEPYRPTKCPCCKKESFQILLNVKWRGPPFDWKETGKRILESLK